MKALTDRLRTVASRPVPVDDRNPAARPRRRAGDPRQSQRGRAPRRHDPDAPHGEEGVAGGWLLRAITLMDLTTLSGDDTPGNVRGSARRRATRCATICSRRSASPRSSTSRSARSACITRSCRPRSRRSRVRAFPVAAVSTGFPGRPESLRAAPRGDPRVVAAAREGDRHRHHARPRAHRQLAGALRRGARVPRGLRRRAHEGDPRHRRAGDARNVARASMVAMQAGADFIKTSTGKEGVNATLPFGS
jgi:deoxyribose-phosphate aldolase